MKIIRPVVTGLIAAVCAELAVISLFNINLFRETGSFVNLFNPIPILIGIAVFTANYKFKVHPVILIVSSAIIGIILL
jgi:chromate transporter